MIYRKVAHIVGILFFITNISFAEVSDEYLIKTYEPVLYFYPEEKEYYPMKVDAYVDECSLWDDDWIDEQVLHKGEVQLNKLSAYDENDFYLSFVYHESVDKVDIESLSPEWHEKAWAIYNAMSEDEKKPAYYAHVVHNDEKNCIAIQYWFFYAMSSWGAYELGGNIHEGDWEMITVFLQSTNYRPVYVAYSQHIDIPFIHDDYDKLIWDELYYKFDEAILEDNTHPVVYVARGSHANYYSAGDFDQLIGLDRTSKKGRRIGLGEWQRCIINGDSYPDWGWFFDYKGKWGTNKFADLLDGSSGPDGPAAKENNDKYYHPSNWAEITSSDISAIGLLSFMYPTEATSLVPDTVNRGQSNVDFLRIKFDFINSPIGIVYINNLQFSLSGTCTINNLNAAKLIDIDSLSVWTGTLHDNNSISFSDILVDDYLTLKLVFDISNSAVPGHTLRITLDADDIDCGEIPVSTKEFPIESHGTTIAPNPDPTITSSLQLLQSPPYYVGDTITATFTIENKGTAPITFKVLTAGGRGPGGDTDVQDFTHRTNITLNPDESYNYQGDLTLPEPGDYHFFCAYQTPDDQWNTDIPTEDGVTNTLDIVVLPSGQTVYVPDDFSTIQAAVNATNSGDIIIVRDGTYTDNIDVNKDLRLRSENGANSTIVQAAYSNDHVFYVTASNVSIMGFTVKGAAGENKAGIAFEDANNGNILSNNCLDNYVGIGLRSSIYNIIKNNNCNSNSKAGIVLFKSNENDIINNISWNNEYGIAISEEEGSDVCAAEQAISQGNITNPEEILNSLRIFRDRNLKTEYAGLYYQYSPDLKGVFLSEPMLSMEALELIMKYMPAIRYMNGEENRIDLPINKPDVEKVISFTEKLKSAINERIGEVGAGRSSEIIKLVEEFEKQFSTFKNKKFSQAFQRSVYFTQKNSGILSRSFENTAIINNTIIGNEIDGINCYYTDVTILNTILWDNGSQGIDLDYSSATVYYSDVQGGWEGIGNIDADPIVVDAENADYHLSDSSPCIGTGTSEGAPLEDIEGNPRGTPPDIGAYENPLDTPLQPSIEVSPNSLNVSIRPGDTATRSLIISNTGDAPLNFSITTQTSDTLTNVNFLRPEQPAQIEPKGSNMASGTGPPTIQGIGGPDAFGYSWKDSDEPDGPTFDYIDISSTGTAITNLGDDDYKGPFNIGLNFNFYGQNYSEFYIASNGYIGFGPTDGYDEYSNIGIPNSELPNNIICWLWDDFDPSSGGTVYYETISNKLIVQFENYPEYDSSNYINAEVILYQDGKIKLQYDNFTPEFDKQGCTIGIENINGSDGLEVALNTDYLHDQLAVLISPWLRMYPTSGVVQTNDSINVDVAFDSTNLSFGDYSADIVISSNDSESPTITVPVSLRVVESLPDLGDVSDDGSVTAYDASLVLQYVVGLIELSLDAQEVADVTGDNTISALDAALILQYTVGLITEFPREQPSIAPALHPKSQDKLLIEAIEQLETISLNTEQKQVLDQLRQLVFQRMIPTHTALLQNFPNPFNPETWLPYQLAKEADVTIRIFSIQGQLIRTLNIGRKGSGLYLSKERAAYWDGQSNTGEKAASGVYFYAIQAGDFNATRKLFILK